MIILLYMLDKILEEKEDQYMFISMMLDNHIQDRIQVIMILIVIKKLY